MTKGMSAASLLIIVMAAVACCGMASARAEGQKPFDHTGLARTMLERHIRPGYQRLTEAAAGLEAAIRPSCEKPDKGQRAQIDAAFDAFVTAWGRIEHISFGPVEADKRRERLFFWPDRRGLGGRQVQRALSTRDDTVLSAATLAAKSVAMQGLLALEILLFGDGNGELGIGEQGTFRCRFALAVSDNLVRVTQEIAGEWARPDGYARDWLAPGSGNPVFLKDSETTQTIFTSFDQGLMRVRDERVAGPIGFHPRGHLIAAPLTISRRTMRLIAANIDGLQELFTAGGLQQAILDANVNHAQLDGTAMVRTILDDFETTRSIAGQMLHIADPYSRAGASDKLIGMGFPLKNIRLQAAALLTLTAGLTLGFNSSDGD